MNQINVIGHTTHVNNVYTRTQCIFSVNYIMYTYCIANYLAAAAVSGKITDEQTPTHSLKTYPCRTMYVVKIAHNKRSSAQDEQSGC